jgi:thymidylate synthase ThyX
MKISLIKFPNDLDWMEVYRRAMVTAGVDREKIPGDNWRRRILEARHSPIRYLQFSFFIEGIPSWVATHLCRHVHAQPYIKSQRNDRQTEYDRNAARQDAPVNMILDVNAEELMVIANKRLCSQASKETRDVVRMMCLYALDVCPEFEGKLVPMCEYHGGKCHEMKPCGRCSQ